MTETIQLPRARIWKVEFGDNFDSRNFNARDFDDLIIKVRHYADKEICETPKKYQADAKENYEITAIELIAEEDLT